MSHSKPIEMKTLLSLIFTGLTLASVSAAEPKTLTIDLPTALKLAQADNAHIAAAREAVNEAKARRKELHDEAAASQIMEEQQFEIKKAAEAEGTFPCDCILLYVIVYYYM